MALLDDIDLLLRDHTGYTGDGQGSNGALPVGDRSTLRHFPDMRTWRELLKAIAQAMGDPEALEDLIQQIGEAGRIYTSRVAAASAASSLPATVTRILVQEGTALVLRSRTASADDPLYPAGDRWGVVQRQDTAAQQEVVNTISVEQELLRADAARVSGIDNTDGATDHPLEYTDPEGNVFHRITRDFVTEFFGGAKIDPRDHSWPFAFTDEEGNIFAGYRDGRWYFAGTPGFDADALDHLDRRNRDRSLAIMSRPRIGVQLPVTETSVIAMLGQSLAKGLETWPSLSKTPAPGALMLGDNVDPTTVSGSYSVIGATQLNPLVAHTRSDSNINLTGAEEAALAPGAQLVGEPPVVGLVNALKRWLNRRAMAVNDGRSLIALSPGVGGRTLEQLSKTPSDGINRYSMVTDGINKAANLAPDAVVPVIGFAQGEYNYASSYGGDTTRAGYRAKLVAYFDDVSADVASRLPDQSDPPLFVTYQTGASYTVDLDSAGQPGLAIGMAQLDLATSDPRVVMAAPVYPYTDKSGHLDSNGSRWMGHHMARAALEVWAGRNFEPTRPMEVVQEGRYIFLHYHVPVPPLVFDRPYQVLTAVDFAAKGYRVTSANGVTNHAIEAVEIVRPTIVRLTMATVPPADALVWYAAKSGTNGNGCVRDSDPTLASDSYEFVPERGMYAAANIPALVGKPYPLQNWSVAFCLPLTYSEF